MKSVAPRQTGPRVLTSTHLTTAATLKTYTYPAVVHVTRAAAGSVSVPLASTLSIDPVQAVQPTATQRKGGSPHHALPVQQAHT